MAWRTWGRAGAGAQRRFVVLLLVLSASLPLAGCGLFGWTSAGWLLPLLALLGLWLAGCGGVGREPAGGNDVSEGGDVVAGADTPGSEGIGLPDQASEEDGPSVPDGTALPDETALPDTPKPPPGDLDGDGILDPDDNCPLVPNPDQLDADNSGYGDACEFPAFISPCCGPECVLDSDGDDIPDVLDLCPWIPDPLGVEGNLDSDGDGVGDDCDTTDDFDKDGVPDVDDNCPRVKNADQTNSDDDGTGCDIHGDACDLCPQPECLSPCGEWCCYDADGDGLPGGFIPPGVVGCPSMGTEEDNCPFAPNPDQEDADMDGIGDACDNCPDTVNPTQWDVNGDGIGDACEADSVATLSPTPPGFSPAAADAGDLARVRVLVGMLVRGTIDSTTFIQAFPDTPDAARVALARALTLRFRSRGILPPTASEG
ncbi:MAG: hypothetical protein FJ109_00005 [Deltaproteobacteria bacterium]|nr:hypothetical protein [Deltaproteobacteria bacterium]